MLQTPNGTCSTINKGTYTALDSQGSKFVKNENENNFKVLLPETQADKEKERVLIAGKCNENNGKV